MKRCSLLSHVRKTSAPLVKLSIFQRSLVIKRNVLPKLIRLLMDGYLLNRDGRDIKMMTDSTRPFIRLYRYTTVLVLAPGSHSDIVSGGSFCTTYQYLVQYCTVELHLKSCMHMHMHI